MRESSRTIVYVQTTIRDGSTRTIMTSHEKIPNIDVPVVLENLIKQCETKCVAQCCGLDAFNFSPLNIAYFFTVYERKPECITKDNVRQIKRDIKTLRNNYERLLEREKDEIGFLKAIKHPIKRKELDTMCEEIDHNIDIARDLIIGMQEKRYKHGKS